MLLQAGLADIVHVRPSAQIAYLLVERARFMDIMEEMQNVSTVNVLDEPFSCQTIWTSWFYNLHSIHIIVLFTI